MTVYEELKFVQRVFNASLNAKVFFIQGFGYIDFSRYSVPSQFHCSLAAAILEDPISRYMKQEYDWESSKIITFWFLFNFSTQKNNQLRVQRKVF